MSYEKALDQSLNKKPHMWELKNAVSFFPKAEATCLEFRMVSDERNTFVKNWKMHKGKHKKNVLWEE